MIKTIIGLFLFLSLLSKPYADVVTGTLPVSTTVGAICTLNSAILNFGGYDPISTNAAIPLDGVTTFQISCTKGLNVIITMNSGLNSGHTQQTTRAMSDGSGNYLSYELYINAGRSNVWTNTNPLSFISTSYAMRTQTIYGRVPGSQNIPAGRYSDTVTITATF
jgi:spore coat protein U-like protein